MAVSVQGDGSFHARRLHHLLHHSAERAFSLKWSAVATCVKRLLHQGEAIKS
ncbi:hypothetical protein [Phocaeicola vulgatus]|uniref:hypothetical protein n=1 Tax=Phocaeicola vulgatus TaxID=821 RepID=UPI0015A52053|nr:hypothetical protein [Phocaeicola vulgatus]